MSKRAKRYYTGEQYWENWKKAGVVGERLNFTDDDIITHQALARTGDIMKNCRAMDAAVAYELASVGSTTEGVTPEKLLSDYTRSAYIIESSRMIGYGKHSDTEQESCGHDEASGVRQYRFKQVTNVQYFEEKNALVITSTTSHAGDIDMQHLSSFISPNALADLFIGDDFSGDITRLATKAVRADGGYLVDGEVLYDTDSLMQLYLKYVMTVCPSTAQYIEDGVDIYFRGQPVSYEGTTLGVCAWEGTDKKCRHHNQVRKTGWAMYVENGTPRELYTNAPCDRNWNTNMLLEREQRQSGSKTIPPSGAPADSPHWVTWDSQRRSMLRSVNDKHVISMIRKSLARMSRRNWGIVNKKPLTRCGDCGSKIDHLPSATNCSACDSENLVPKTRGNNAIYKWKDWGWLADVHAYIQTTRTKNRKAGDIENGWEWYAHKTTQSYGMDISEFAWRPAEAEDVTLFTFTINSETKRKSYYGSGYRTDTKTVMDYREVLLFYTKEAAEKAAQEIMSKIQITDEQVVKSRLYREGEFAPQPRYSVQYATVWSDFIMKPEIDPEDYLSPKEVNKLFVSASPEVLKMHRDKFMSMTTPVNTVVEKKEESND